MDNKDFKIRAYLDPAYRAISLYMEDRGAYVTDFKLEQIRDNTCCPVAARLEMSQAQELMDGLWTAGIRPTEGKGSAGAMAATEKHLKDMQKIAFESHDIIKKICFQKSTREIEINQDTNL